MRAITKAAITAFKANGNFRKDNTVVLSEDGQTKMFLFGNKIAEKLSNGDIYITNAGWNSSTTYDRLNAIDGVRINIVKGIPQLNGKPWDGKWTKIN